MYSTIEDLQRLLPEDELLQLADDEDSGSLDEEAVVLNLVESIDQADREIDAYVSMVRNVPLDPVPPLVANMSARMAVYHLFARRSQVPALWAERYASCVRQLEGVAEGRLGLGQAAAESLGRVRSKPVQALFRNLIEEM